MRGRIGASVMVFALATVALGIAIVAGAPTQASLDAYVLVVGADVLLALVSATRLSSAHNRSTFDAALADPDLPRTRPASLEQLEREVYLYVGSAFYLHYRARPLFRELASHRLGERLGIDLDRQPEAARVALGPVLWEIVRPGREPPEDRHAPGLPLPALGEAVGALERIGR